MKPNHHTLPIILGAIGGVLAFLILSGLILCYVNHKRGPKQPPLDYASGKLLHLLIGYFVEGITLWASVFPTCWILVLSLLVSLCRSRGLMLYNNLLEPIPCLWRAVAENSSQRYLHCLELMKSAGLHIDCCRGCVLLVKWLTYFRVWFDVYYILVSDCFLLIASIWVCNSKRFCVKYISWCFSLVHWLPLSASVVLTPILTRIRTFCEHVPSMVGPMCVLCTMFSRFVTLVSLVSTTHNSQPWCGTEIFSLSRKQYASCFIMYEEIKYATRNFNRGNRIGEGAYGAVYKVNSLLSSLPLMNN